MGTRTTKTRTKHGPKAKVPSKPAASKSAASKPASKSKGRPSPSTTSARPAKPAPEKPAKPKLTFRNIGQREETRLIRRYQQGDNNAGTVLLKIHEAFIWKMAQKFARRGLESEDLFQEARMGFLKAVSMYEPSREVKLTTYAAHWTRQHAQRAVQNTGSTVRLPVHVFSALAIAHKQGIEGADAMAEAGILSAGIAHSVMLLQRGTLSLDILTVNEEGQTGQTIGDTLMDSAPSQEEEIEERQRHEGAKRALELLFDGLSDRERDVVISRFGRAPGDDQTLDAVASRYGLTREAIRQIQMRAAGKMRTNATRLGPREIERLLPMIDSAKTSATNSRRILDVLADGERSTNALRARIGLTKDSLGACLERLVEANAIEPGERAGTWRLVASDED